MKTKTFIIKILKLIAIILFLLIIMIVVIKKWHLILHWIKCLHNSLGRHSTRKNWMFPFLFYASSLDIFIITQKRLFDKSFCIVTRKFEFPINLLLNGFEPSTYSFGGSCSIQMSYKSKNEEYNLFFERI